MSEQIVVASQYSDSDIDFEEFEQEVKSYVTQLISLIQTIIDSRENRDEMLLQFATLTQNKDIQSLSK